MDNDFVVKFDSVKLDSVELPKFIIKNFTKIGIKANEWHLFSLISCLEEEGAEIPPQDELAVMMGLSERQLKQIVASLKKKGLLRVNRGKNGKKYDFKPLLDKAYQLSS
jgi:DNA-binding MarR family transcriptional regulator